MSVKIELTEDGYEKIEARIQTIENLASNGIFAEESRTSRFYQIVSETKKLRQILRDVLLIVPAKKNDKGDAA
ncbi:MAG: hypothetical protein FWD47_12815 [Treponema sp.]|nr:hypothetical protein [Treponema sp.]